MSEEILDKIIKIFELFCKFFLIVCLILCFISIFNEFKSLYNSLMNQPVYRDVYTCTDYNNNQYTCYSCNAGTGLNNATQMRCELDDGTVIAVSSFKLLNKEYLGTFDEVY